MPSLKHMSRKPKQGDYIYFEVEQHKGKSRATNARIEGVKSNFTVNVSKGYKSRSGNKLIYAAAIIAIVAFTFQRLELSNQKLKPNTQQTPMLIPSKTAPKQQFTCDGRQYCSDMTSREEALYFTKHCPNTKMDGDNDGKPCENDSRF